MPDGDGSVLVYSILLYGSNMSNSNAHDEFPLPIMVVGRRRREVEGQPAPQVRRQDAARPTHVTLLERAGVPIEKVGDSERTFSEI